MKTWRNIAICLVGLTVLLSAGAAQSKFNGDMEQISEVAKGMNKWLMRQIQKGCDFGDGPVAYLPAGWGINIGVAKFYSIDAAEVPEDKPNVHGGTASMYLAAKTPTHVQCTNRRFEPGTYRVSFWMKGTGTVHVLSYNYRDTYHFVGSGPFVLNATATDAWKKFEGTVSFGHDREGTTYSIFVLAADMGAKVCIDDIVAEKVD